MSFERQRNLVLEAWIDNPVDSGKFSWVAVLLGWWWSYE